MSARVLNIVDKVKPFPSSNTAPENFVLSDGESVPPQIVVDNPNLSLYCLDDERKEALFVETPPEVDLSQAPFYYVTQYEHALRLIALSYDRFHQIADDIPLSRLIVIHSTGRCGSTLISQAFNTVEGVRSLSEPDIYTQIHLMRYLDRSRDDDYARLLASSTKFYCLNTPVLALKFRAMCIFVGDLLYRAFPDATNLFLYRNAETWVRSMGLEFQPPEERRALAENPPLHRRSMAPLLASFNRAAWA